MFSNKVIQILSWSYSLKPRFTTKKCGYDWVPHNKCHSVNIEQQVIVFHGAKNTEYEFTVTEYIDNCHSSFGIPSDFYYFYGVTYYDPSLYSQSDGGELSYSIYLNKFIKSPVGLKFTFTTNNEGNFEFMVTNCYVAGHSAHINLDISVYGYKQKSLNFDYRLPNYH